MQDQKHLGKYEILGEIGKGGFATVYRARDTVLGREVALKVLDPLLMRDKAFVERFKREAQAASALRHPHIITIHDLGEVGGRLYIAMELIEEADLGVVTTQRGRVPWDETLQVIDQIAGALAYAHGRSLVHRDLKPANVLLDPQRGAVVTDFGFAKALGSSSASLTISGGVIGTPAYIPPEIWDGEEATPATDVYALACLTYEMLTGQPLFSGATPSATMRRHFQPPRFPEQWPPGVPAGIDDVLAAALAQNPTERMADPARFVAALRELLGTSEPEPSTLEQIIEAPEPEATQETQSDLAGPVTPKVQRSSAPQPPAEPRPTPPPRPTALPRVGRGCRKVRGIPTWVWVLGAVVLVGGGIGLALIVGLAMMTGPGPQTPAAAPTAVSTRSVATESPGVGGFQLKVVNQTSADICYVLISPSAADEWGDDWLGDEEIIKTGMSRVFDVPGEPHDAMFLNCDEAVLATIFEVNSDFTLTVGGAGLVELVAYNKSSIELCYVYISPTTSDDWGEDWLGGKEVISAGDGVRIFYVAPGAYDLLAQDCDGEDVVTETEVELDSDTDWTISD